jgi:putative Mg2+ transporter-C (MgtC) family protein
MLTHEEMIIRILVGALLGGVIGYERDLHGRQAGLRTHLIVAMASATFMVVSAHFMFYQYYNGSATMPLAIDPSRIAASVVSGVGFLAGGTILKSGLTIQGLTTAASLWLVTAIGLCAGSGMYVEGVVVTVLGVVALTLLRILEDANGTPRKRRVSLTVNGKSYDESRFVKALKELGVRIVDFEYEKDLDSRKLNVSFTAYVPPILALDRLIEVLENQKGVRRLQVLLPK